MNRNTRIDTDLGLNGQVMPELERHLSGQIKPHPGGLRVASNVRTRDVPIIPIVNDLFVEAGPEQQVQLLQGHKYDQHLPAAVPHERELPDFGHGYFA
jgi:hypothetical protein